jgi:hypothetical protein
MRTKMLWLALALVAVLALAATANGTVQGLITGKQIAPHSITSLHMVNGTIQAHDLSPGLVKSLQGKTGAKGDTGARGDTGATGATGAKGDNGTKGDRGDKGETGPQGPPGLSNLEADGPYPGLTQLGDYANAGANSTAMWASGSTLQQSWVMCAPGKVAVGGGFGQNDVQSDKLIIVTSAPAYIDGAGNVDPPGTPAKDAEGSIVPNGWLVQGYNESGQNLVVRPWVICATVK